MSSAASLVPRTGTLLLISATAFRTVDGRGIMRDHPLINDDYGTRTFGIVIARQEGTADWAKVMVLTAHGLYQYQVTSMNPSAGVVQIVDDLGRMGS